MDKNNIAKRIIEQKKLNGSRRKPKYATRKLSVGLVSCMLGYALLFSPSSAQAAGETGEEIVAEDKVEPSNDNQSSDEQASEAPTVSDTTNESTENTAEENKEVAAPADQTVEAEKANNEKDVEEKEKIAKPKELEDKSKLEIAPEKEFVNEKAEDSNIVNDISDKLTNTKITIETPNNKEATKIKPIEGVAKDDYDTLLNANVEFNVPSTTRENDYVDIDLSNNVSVNGLIENFKPEALDSYYGPDLIAKAYYDMTGKKLRYTFTKGVEKYGNVKVRTEFPLFIDKQVVTANGDQKVEVSVGNKTESKTYNIDCHLRYARFS